MAKGIFDHGLDGDIRRLTLMEKLGLKPDSSKTKELESSSNKYGLTTGGSGAENKQLTESGRTLLDAVNSAQSRKEKLFELAIGGIEPFNALYEKLKGKRIPDAVVLKDELETVGVAKKDAALAARIFEANVRFLGLLKEVTGSEYVRSLEETLEEALEESESMEDFITEHEAEDPPLEETAFVEDSESTDVTAMLHGTAPVEKNGNRDVTAGRPALHIDIQVHIDPTSSAEQIDQIFESMARHLYGSVK